MISNSKIKGVLGAESLGEGGSRNVSIEARGKAFPPIILGLLSLACTLLALADVECNWANGTYVCSGVGDSVIVHSGGDNTGGNAPVYTNGLGVCTNCSQIAPNELAQLANALRQESEDTFSIAGTIILRSSEIYESCTSNNQDIATFLTFDATKTSERDQAYLIITNNPSYNTQTQIVHDELFKTTLNAILYRKYFVVGGLNSVHSYANNVVAPTLYDIQTKAETCAQEAQRIQDVTHRVGTLYQNNDDIEPTIATRMEEGAVACQVSMNTNNAAGGDGATTGDWCTYEQGEALKKAMKELKDYTAAISNKLDQYEVYLKGIKNTIKQGLFTDYNKIPESVGDEWREIYNSPETSNFGYANTNILARIELLLYGLTKPYTNDTPFTEDSEITSSPEDMESKGEEWKSAVNNIRSDANDREVQSLGSALADFVRAISYTGREVTEGQELIPEITYQLNGEYHSIAPFTVQNASLVNDFRHLTRALVTALCAFALAVLTFIYWRWFAEKCIKFTRWGTEIITSMFAS